MKPTVEQTNVLANRETRSPTSWRSRGSESFKYPYRYMIKPNFAAMSNFELKAYVLQHRDDDDALHELTVRVQTQGKRLNSIEELKQVIQEKRCLTTSCYASTPQQT